MLRAHTENVVWTRTGNELDWPTARAAALQSLRELAGREGRQEYRIRVGDVDGIVTSGIAENGSVELDGLGESSPLERDGTGAAF